MADSAVGKGHRGGEKPLSHMRRFGLGEMVDDADRHIDDAARYILDGLRQSVAEKRAVNLKESQEFSEHIDSLWGVPLATFEMSIGYATESGARFNRKYRPAAAQSGDYLFEALTRLHGRACRVSREVLLLMRNGYASAAFTRWRTLHEIAVVSNFIRKYGGDIAERYHLYEYIESATVVNTYQRWCSRLGYEPFSADEVAETQANKEQLCRRFGKNYAKLLGWAYEALGNPTKNVTISTLERAANLDHLRPFYGMASHDVHAGPKGIRFNMGISLKSAQDLILAGASDGGMAEPGHCSMISLLQVSTALLSTRENIEALVDLKVLRLLVDEAEEEFLNANIKYEERRARRLRECIRDGEINSQPPY